MTADSDRAPAREEPDLQIDQQMARFLDALPVGVFIALPGGQPFYANPEAMRLLGRGIIPSVSSEEISEVYRINIRGTGEPYPTERLPVVAALNGDASNRDDMDVCHPDGTIVPLQAWGTPVAGPAGSVEHALVAFVDVSERIGAQEALRVTQERFRASMEILPDGIAIFSAVRDRGGRIKDFRYEYINEAGCRTDQRTREGTLGHTMIELFPESVTAGLFAAYAEVVETGEPLVREDIDYENFRGGRRVIRAFDVRVVKLADGIVVTWRDVSQRTQAAEMLARQAADLENAAADLEERVQLRTAELLSSNRELEVFSYSVAHDLRAPLRAIHGYSQILLEEHAGQLDEDGQVLLADVGRYIERMSELIDGLLALAGVGRRDLEQASIDMTALAEAAVTVLRAAAPGRLPRIVVARMPGTIGDPALIGQVWANLISNAVKFCADQPGAEVRVESETAGEEIIYHVRDNGAGFDMAYAGKLFGVFQRLHHATEFSGNGIGLAIVARIVDRHGGRVWAEGRVNGGACFSFTLPVVRSEKRG